MHGQPPKRRSQEGVSMNLEAERKELLRQIAFKHKMLSKLDRKGAEQSHKLQRLKEHNSRNEKRIMRYRARMEEMTKHKDSPEHFLTMSGYMNEYIQEYILSHDFALQVNPNQPLNPDNMTYEQLIELGEQIGRVSKGLSKEQIELLHHRKGRPGDDSCPVCQCDIGKADDVIELKCKHSYHEECVLLWLRDENTCPICKEYLGSAKGEEEEV